MREDTGSPVSPFQKYVNDGLLDIAAIECLREDKIANLNSAVLRSLFEAGKLKFEEVRDMHTHVRVQHEARYAITETPDGIQDLIKKKHLTEEEARGLTLDQRNILLGVDPIDAEESEKQSRAAVRAQFLAGKLHVKLLSYPKIQKYVDDKNLKPEAIDKLEPTQKLYLNNDVLRDLFEKGRVTFQELLDLTSDQWQKLKDPQVVEKVKKGELLVKLLDHPVLQAYVTAREVRPDELDGLLKPQDDATKNRSANLHSDVLLSLYQDRKLTFAQVLALTAGQRTVFEAKNSEALASFRDGKLLLELVEQYNVRKYVDAKIQYNDGKDIKPVTLEDIAKLSLTQRVMLNSPVVCELVTGGHLKYSQVMGLTPQQGQDLANNKDGIAEKIKAKTMIVVANVGFVSVAGVAPKAVMHGAAAPAAGSVNSNNDQAQQKVGNKK